MNWFIYRQTHIAASAGMAELADAPDLGSGGRPCRFKSCYPQEIRDFKAYVALKSLIFLKFGNYSVPVGRY